MKYILRSVAQSVAQNVEFVRRRIAAACLRAGRDPEEVTLVAVTKTVGGGLIKEAVQAGVRDVGENFVQELLAKRESLGDDGIRWHFIGHLQSNKVRQIAGWIHLVHSVDSLSLASEISKKSAAAGKTAEILIEVKTTGETTKFGVQPPEVLELAKKIGGLPNLKASGLMTIGPFLPDAESSRPSFRQLRSLRDLLASEGFGMTHLSMGMTNDFEVAIEEGATIVRIGTAIFGPRIKPANEPIVKEGHRT
jgi:pyridoxal phosphate enzyme (YggS family)